MAKRRVHNKYIQQIDDEIDLHGFTAYEARQTLNEYIREARAHGWHRIRVVVGKGTHSQYGPVLPDVVKAYLAEHHLTYTYAKPHEGGEGALEVTIE